jgi:alanine dehydrogenase
VTIRYARALAAKGPEEAARTDKALALGFNTFGGHVTYEAVARDLDLGYRSLESLLK